MPTQRQALKLPTSKATTARTSTVFSTSSSTDTPGMCWLCGVMVISLLSSTISCGRARRAARAHSGSEQAGRRAQRWRWQRLPGGGA